MSAAPCSTYPSVPASAAVILDSDWSGQEPAAWVTSSGKPSLRPHFWRGWQMRPWSVRLFGRTLRGSAAEDFAAAWISSLPASRVSASQLLAEAAASPMTSGLRSGECYAKSGPASSSSRTSRSGLFDEPSDALSEMDGERRMTRSAPPSWVPQLTESGGGYLPTPTTRCNQQSPSMRKWPAYERLHRLSSGETLSPEFWEFVMGLPIGWTACVPLATRSAPSKSSMRSELSRLG